jgi:hypothetical protein
MIEKCWPYHDLDPETSSQCNNYTTLATLYKFTGRQNIIKYCKIPLLLNVIHYYMVMLYQLKETPAEV